ncbi:hypothetical protein [Bradyrhizobium sp. CCGB01]|uniref:hypothetical protein n=1 Tax=Bradyrhizobium sp. CCGB01 TaxID=2949634 RepID=UPI0035C6E786
MRCDRIDAPWFIEGPIDGASFRTYVERVLLPVLRPAISSSWTTSAATGAKQFASSSVRSGPKLFFLPKYSPDLNPIEHQAQAPAPKSRRANRRCGLRGNWPGARRFHTRGMRQLSQKLRLSNLMPSRFWGLRTARGSSCESAQVITAISGRRISCSTERNPASSSTSCSNPTCGLPGCASEAAPAHARITRILGLPR